MRRMPFPMSGGGGGCGGSVVGIWLELAGLPFGGAAAQYEQDNWFSLGAPGEGGGGGGGSAAGGGGEPGEAHHVLVD